MRFLRTSENRFAALPDFAYPPRYADVGGLRLAYVEAGPPEGEPVLLLHGEPSWSFLYRKVIPVLAGAGLRAIAADLVGFGRSDKPAEIGDHSYARHVEWIRPFAVDRLDLRAAPPGRLAGAGRLGQAVPGGVQRPRPHHRRHGADPQARRAGRSRHRAPGDHGRRSLPAGRRRRATRRRDRRLRPFAPDPRLITGRRRLGRQVYDRGCGARRTPPPTWRRLGSQRDHWRACDSVLARG